VYTYTLLTYKSWEKLLGRVCMRKYPFSSKAIKAIMAATIALSPVIISGVANQTVIAAENGSIDSLMSKQALIYEQLTTEQRGYLGTTQGALAGLGWEGYAKKIISSSNPTAAEISIVKGLMELISSSTVLNVQGKINQFRSSQAVNVKTVFGDAVSVDDVLTFVADVQLQFITNVESAGNLNEDEYFSLFIDAFITVQGNSAHTTVVEKFFSLVDPIKTVSVFNEVSSNVDTNTRTALIQAIQKAANPGEGTNPGTGGTPGTPGTPGAPGTPGKPGSGGTPAGEVPSQHVITLPEKAAEVVKESNPSGKVYVVTKVASEKVDEIVNSITATQYIIPLQLEKPATGEAAKAQVPAGLITGALKQNSKSLIEVKSTDGATYKFPVSQINISDLAKKLGVTEANLVINFSINKVATSEFQGIVTKNNLKIDSNVVDFTVEAVAGNKTEKISKFSTYVERDIVGSKTFNKKSSVAVKINENGTVSPIPTLFTGNVATIKSLTNSKYTIVENSKIFSDVSQTSWAKPYIDTLASKYIVHGKTNDKYDPSALMTRAEFAVLLVRALGLPTSTYDGSFDDVSGNEWFAKNGELTAAVQYGIVKGVSVNKFDPNAKVTRAQAAVMIQRAMEMDFLNYNKSQLNQSRKLTDFKDNKQIGSWAKAGVEAVYQAGIVSGKGENFDPNGYTQRQEMAKILANFLVSAKLMN
jgi:hypothetical protein